jgi:hypothetical protein
LKFQFNAFSAVSSFLKYKEGVVHLAEFVRAQTSPKYSVLVHRNWIGSHELGLNFEITSAFYLVKHKVTKIVLLMLVHAMESYVVA